MSRYFLEVSYKGANYSGFQVKKYAEYYTSRNRKGI